MIVWKWQAHDPWDGNVIGYAGTEREAARAQRAYVASRENAEPFPDVDSSIQRFPIVGKDSLIEWLNNHTPKTDSG